MNESPNTTLHIGAYGWQAQGLLSEFYPEDLPPEWRLSYLANEFDCVLVPAAYWHEADWPDTAQWRDDVQAHFRFFLEIDAVLHAGAHWPRLLDDLSAMADRIGGLVLKLGSGQYPQVIRELGKRVAGIPLYSCDVVPTLPVAHLWRSDETTCPCAPLALVEAQALDTPMKLRRTLEGFVACAGVEELYLFVEGGVQAMMDARTMAVLLGHY